MLLLLYFWALSDAWRSASMMFVVSKAGLKLKRKTCDLSFAARLERASLFTFYSNSMPPYQCQLSDGDGRSFTMQR